MRMLRLGLTVALVVASAACGSDDAEPVDRAAGTIAGPAAELPPEPPACSGPARASTEEIRRQSWRQAVGRAEDPGAETWVSFRRVLTLDEVARLPPEVLASGVQLTYRQQQGTYVKAQVGFAPAPVRDPALGDAARRLLESTLAAPPVSLPGVAAGALDPTDPAVAAGQPPISALRASGGLAALLRLEDCLVYALAPGEAPSGPLVSPEIEPDP